MNATQEQWRPVVGFEGIYEVSDQGRVRSLDRIVYFSNGRKRRSPGRILKPWASNRGGYPVVGLKGETTSRKALVHVLVLEAFVGPRPEGMACCHNDGDGQNNTLANLRWDTYSSNNHDLVVHGTHFQASKTHCPRGHEYTEPNTRIYIYGGSLYRYCRACAKQAGRKYKAKLKAERARNPKRHGPKPKTECKRGHALTPDNVYQWPNGRGRSCRRCIKLRSSKEWGSSGSQEYM